MGRRRIFVVGAVWFTVASVLCAAAPSAELLIAARVLQGDRRRPAHTRAAWRSSSPRSPPRTAHGRSVPGPASAAWPPGSARSSAAGSSTWRRGDRSSSSTSRSASPWWRSPYAPRPGVAGSRELGPPRSGRRRARRRRPRRHHLRLDGAAVADLRHRDDHRRRLRPRRAAQPFADGADAHLPVGPVQRHQRRDVPALRRLRRRAVHARPRAAGPARLLAAARRSGDRAADDHDAAVLCPRRGHRPAHRPADPDDRRAAAVRRRARPADARRARGAATSKLCCRASSCSPSA